MATTTLLIKTDKRLKEKARKIVREMGIPLSAYLNAQLRELVNTRRAVFEAPLVPNAKTKRQLHRALKDIKIGKNVQGPFTSKKELDDYLMSLR
ncbi:type II toxin-antitoxin system RelB/DinJ family antitoxin [Candidatus Uhrbacteria bacterium]|nr:type II toxin-antitoxin system RelB/DinJ family antitoxin [Candidatus Uhrbacteria bacterium]